MFPARTTFPLLFARIRFLDRDDLFKRSHWNMNCEHWTRSELYYSVRCGTKECRVQRTPTTHSHDHQVGLCFKGELHDLLVRLAGPDHHLNPPLLSRVGRNGFFQL